MIKDPQAFRTISEVSASLGVPQHILRFWETRFPELKPLKRGGNRRYYRPADVAFAASLRRLLHDEGYTVKGVQKLVAEYGVAGVVAMSEEKGASLAATTASAPIAPSPAGPTPEIRSGLVAIRDRLAAALAA